MQGHTCPHHGVLNEGPSALSQVEVAGPLELQCGALQAIAIKARRDDAVMLVLEEDEVSRIGKAAIG